jgi:tetratricopeptide (TPR) repeat protein
VSVVDGRPPSETLRLLDGSETLNPDFRRDTGKAGFLARMGRRDEAAAILRDATEREPENARIWLESIPVWLELGRRDEALRAYARAKDLDSQLPRTELPPAD